MTNRLEVTACLLVIGNEILSGRTQDVNLAHIAQRLNDWGVRLREARVIPDVEEVIVTTLNECRATFDYVLTTGGIGPTHDDITAACVAKAFGVPLIRNPEAVAIMKGYFENAGVELNDARLRMANTPEGATLIDNPVSRAPGFRMGNVFVMAGVPKIMQAMLESLRHDLVGGDPVHSLAIAAELAEGTLAGDLGSLQERYPDVDIGSYPYYRKRRFGVTVVLRHVDKALLSEVGEGLRAIIRRHGAEPIETTKLDRD